jgi:hypothetical protein
MKEGRRKVVSMFMADPHIIFHMFRGISFTSYQYQIGEI